MNDKPQLRRTNTLTPSKPPTWLGIGWIPRSEITVLVGDEGIGKSLLWVQVAAAVTTGKPFAPFNIPSREPADVLVIVTEDATAEVQERLKLAGADLDRIIWFSIDADGTGAPTFSRHGGGEAMATLMAGIKQMEVPPALVVLDAWLDTVDAGLQVKDSQQARIALNPWKVFADRFKTSVMLLTHTNRLQTSNTRDKMGNTNVLRQKARMVLYAARPNGDHQSLYVGPDKTNTSRVSGAMKFTVEPVQVRPATDDDPGTTARLSNPTKTGQSIGSLLSDWQADEREAHRKPTKQDEAVTAIVDLFRQRGATSMASHDVDEYLKGQGFGQRVISTAKGVAGESRPAGHQGAWLYTLKSQSMQSPSMSVETANTAQTAESEVRQ